MADPNRRGKSGNPVSTGMQGDNYTPFANTHFILPYGLRLRQTINAGTTSVTIPTGISFVYAICVGSGGGAQSNGANGGGAGGVAWGWTIATSRCVVGAGVSNPVIGNFTRYGNIIAGGGGAGGQAGQLGGAGGGQQAGSTNYWGIPGGVGPSASPAKGNTGSGAGGGNVSSAPGSFSGHGGDGISGGGGGGHTGTSGTCIAGSGGTGLAGGGGARSLQSSNIRRGGYGGRGFNILTGLATNGGIYSQGTNTSGAGGGGAGIAGNGTSAVGNVGGSGGLGGGGAGGGATNGTSGAGLLYLFY